MHKKKKACVGTLHPPQRHQQVSRALRTTHLAIIIIWTSKPQKAVARHGFSSWHQLRRAPAHTSKCCAELHQLWPWAPGLNALVHSSYKLWEYWGQFPSSAPNRPELVECSSDHTTTTSSVNRTTGSGSVSVYEQSAAQSIQLCSENSWIILLMALTVYMYA